jgi:hypothetical protein
VLTRTQQRHTVAACFLSWTLDAFDFFIMVFVLADIAKEFSTTMAAVTIADHTDLGGAAACFSAMWRIGSAAVAY